MGKQVRVKGYQSILNTEVLIEGDYFIPENYDFLRAFKVPNFLSVLNKIEFQGYISSNLKHLLGPGDFSEDIIQTKETKKFGAFDNPFIYVSIQVSKILYFEVKSNFFNMLNYFDFVIEIDYVRVFLKERKNNSKNVLINVNHGCGIYTNPQLLKETQSKNNYNFLKAIESVVAYDLSNSLEKDIQINYKYRNPDTIICFLTKKVNQKSDFDNQKNIKLIINHISSIDLSSVPLSFKIYVTSKEEILKKLTPGSLINDIDLDKSHLILLQRVVKNQHKKSFESISSYKIISEDEEILKIIGII
jgi:hypothetical protein